MELVEREAELEGLTAALGRAAAGSGRVVLIRGEAGIGKTSLVRTFIDGLGRTDRSAGGDAPQVVTGRCDDLATPRELGPLWDLARSVPPLEAALESGDRARVHQAALDLIGQNRPTVLLEDLRWADAATLDLVEVPGRRIDGSRALLVAGARRRSAIRSIVEPLARLAGRWSRPAPGGAGFSPAGSDNETRARPRAAAGPTRPPSYTIREVPSPQ